MPMKAPMLKISQRHPRVPELSASAGAAGLTRQVRKFFNVIGYAKEHVAQ